MALSKTQTQIATTIWHCGATGSMPPPPAFLEWFEIVGWLWYVGDKDAWSKHADFHHGFQIWVRTFPPRATKKQ